MKRSADKMFTVLFATLTVGFFLVNLAAHSLTIGVSVLLDEMSDAALFAGIAGSIFSVAAGLTRVLSGPLIDNMSRFRVAVAGLVVLAVGSLLPAFLGTTWIVLFSRILQGVGFSAATTAMSTMAADVLPMSRLGEGIGYFNLASALAMTVGPAIGLALAISNVYLFSFTAIIVLAGLLAVLMCNYEKNPQRLLPTAGYRHSYEAENAAVQRMETPDGAASELAGESEDADGQGSNAAKKVGMGKSIFVRTAFPASFVMLLYAPASAFSTFFAGVYGIQLGIENPGLYYTFAAILSVITRFAGRSFMDTADPRKLFTVSNGAGALAFVCLLGSAYVPILYYVAGILVGVMVGIGFPLLISLAVKATDPGRWGSANALVSLAYDAGMAVSSTAWGSLLDLFGFAFVQAASGIMCIVAIIAMWCVIPASKKRGRERAESNT